MCLLSRIKQWPGIMACYRILQPLLPHVPVGRLPNYIRFWKSYRAYRAMLGRAPCKARDLDIQIGDWCTTTPISYYFYQDTWAFRKIALARPEFHVDVGSTALLVGCMAAIVPTISVDVRPLVADVPGLKSMTGTITALPFESDYVPSISALCVIEHIGLGRYGDPLDTEGSRKAARELARVLKRGGDLYVSVPCGRSYTAFNAHRSFEKDEFIRMFPGLTLKEYVLVTNLGATHQFCGEPRAGLHVGLFHFTK